MTLKQEKKDNFDLNVQQNDCTVFVAEQLRCYAANQLLIVSMHAIKAWFSNVVRIIKIGDFSDPRFLSLVLICRKNHKDR